MGNFHSNGAAGTDLDMPVNLPGIVGALGASSAMGKLNIAHHKSYHPYRRDNIERVRKDEEEARRKEENEDGRMMLAVSCHDNPCCPNLDSKDLFIIGL